MKTDLEIIHELDLDIDASKDRMHDELIRLGMPEGVEDAVWQHLLEKYDAFRAEQVAKIAVLHRSDAVN